jgi:hypothetical protein
MKKLTDRGGVRELSYDGRYARPHGQTAEQIHREATQPQIPHKPMSDRFYLLRFLGLGAHS